jgi:TolB-like protein/tetratricopeptide (TPR) repeat protein
MGSIIKGYENDVFISYRQNDNRASGAQEGWVTEFVEYLSAELEATVKEKLTIYFDKNPHHGLLETHSVDESLSLKIKSLIFIPIISQTYCDTTSFAWQNELLPFIKFCGSDKYGHSIKLLNGNVASRVLPIRIHELDTEDVQLIEKVLKGKLRPIDFIFKSSGVNRPLRHNEEDPLKNSFQTFYRDQINKIANAVKDLINGFKNFEVDYEKSPTTKKIHAIPIDLDNLSSGNKAIAVLPFININIDKDDEYLCEALAEDVLNLLNLVKRIKVVPRNTSFQWAGNANVLELKQKLSVGKVVEGVLEKRNGQLMLAIKLTSTTNESVLWSGDYIINQRDLIRLTQSITSEIIKSFQIKVTDSERSLIEKMSTTNSDAYMHYLKGRYSWHRKSDSLIKGLGYFQQSVELDPNFSLAYAGIANTHILLGYYKLEPFHEAIDKAKRAAFGALQIDPTITEAWSAMAFVNMCYEWNWPEAEQYFSKVFAIYPGHAASREKLERYLNIIIKNLEDAALEPVTIIPYFLQAYALLHFGKFDEAMNAARLALNKEPSSFMAHRALGLSFIGMERYDEAVEALEKAASLSNRHQWVLFELMGTYMLAGKIEEAHAIMDEALVDFNALPSRICNFYFPNQ